MRVNLITYSFPRIQVSSGGTVNILDSNPLLNHFRPFVGDVSRPSDQELSGATANILDSVPLVNHLAPHALLRMQQRGIRPELVEQVLRYGRAIHARGLLFRVIGRKEVAFFAARGINLRAAEGVHVLVQPDGSVLTTYRNQNLRAIRPCKRKHAMHH